MEGDILIWDWLRGLKGQAMNGKEGLAGAAIGHLGLLHGPRKVKEAGRSNTKSSKEEKHDGCTEDLAPAPL